MGKQNEPKKVPPPLPGENVRGEVTGCPTGLADTPLSPAPAEGPQGAQPGTIYSPGEGVNEEEQRRSGLNEDEKG